MSLPSLSGTVSSSDEEELDGFIQIARDGEEKCDIVCLDSELLAAARDVERLSEAINRREKVISELTHLRMKEKEEFEQRKNELHAEMRMLRGMVQSLNVKLQSEREKRRQVMSRKFSRQSDCEFLSCDGLGK
jgi:predicted RNase H-like nuclease (RuvC/YqgF family)